MAKGELASKQSTDVKLLNAFWRGSQLPVVIKKHSFPSFSLSDVKSRVNNALQAALIQGQLRHPHICELIELQVDVECGSSITIYHALEALDSDIRRDIEVRKETGSLYSEIELREVLYQTSQALAYMHKQKIAHRDIKPGNIFRTGEVYKIGDFGDFYEIKHGSTTKSAAGTTGYMSPQLREACVSGECEYSPVKADVFSLGATLLEMATLVSPQDTIASHDLDIEVGKALANLQYSESLKALIRAMLAYEESERPTMEQVCLARIVGERNQLKAAVRTFIRHFATKAKQTLNTWKNNVQTLKQRDLLSQVKALKLQIALTNTPTRVLKATTSRIASTGFHTTKAIRGILTQLAQKPKTALLLWKNSTNDKRISPYRQVASFIKSQYSPVSFAGLLKYLSSFYVTEMNWKSVLIGEIAKTDYRIYKLWTVQAQIPNNQRKRRRIKSREIPEKPKIADFSAKANTPNSKSELQMPLFNQEQAESPKITEDLKPISPHFLCVKCKSTVPTPGICDVCLLSPFCVHCSTRFAADQGYCRKCEVHCPCCRQSRQRTVPQCLYCREKCTKCRASLERAVPGSGLERRYVLPWSQRTVVALQRSAKTVPQPSTAVVQSLPSRLRLPK